MSVVYIKKYLEEKIIKYSEKTNYYLGIVEKMQKEGKEKFVNLPLTKAKECAHFKRNFEMRLRAENKIIYLATFTPVKCENPLFDQYTALVNKFKDCKIV